MKFVESLTIEYTRKYTHHILVRNLPDFIDACKELGVKVIFFKKRDDAIRYVAFVNDIILEYVGFAGNEK